MTHCDIFVNHYIKLEFFFHSPSKMWWTSWGKSRNMVHWGTELPCVQHIVYVSEHNCHSLLTNWYWIMYARYSGIMLLGLFKIKYISMVAVWWYRVRHCLSIIKAQLDVINCKLQLEPVSLDAFGIVYSSTQNNVIIVIIQLSWFTRSTTDPERMYIKNYYTCVFFRFEQHQYRINWVMDILVYSEAI